ncbi:hypothetical protein SAMN04488109_3544 [Chryseolinea serpens]|uniref:CcmD family protein n=1 Tax=Chryseolinea serpens TaxID=947013 RepID=A0A1M5RS80_9BACT|nr:hypothetical protein SAMN04488109_3544 [Chryseolinea serpens]
MNANYLLLFPVIYAAMCVYLAILVAVTQRRAAKRKGSNVAKSKRETSSHVGSASDSKRFGVEGH